MVERRPAQKYLDAFQADAPKLAQAKALDDAAAAYRQTPGLVKEYKPPLEIPFLRYGKQWADRHALEQASARMEAGTASYADIQEVATQRVQAELEARQGFGERAADMARTLPAFLAEWGALSGPASAAKGLVSARVASLAGEGALSTVAGAAAAGATRTALNLPALAPSAAGGQFWQGALNNFVENTAFEGLHPFEKQVGDKFLTRLAKGLGSAATANEAAGDLQAVLGNDRLRGGPFLRLSLAQTPQEQQAAWNDLKAQAAVFGGLEGLINARGDVQARAQDLPAQGLDDAHVRAALAREYDDLGAWRRSTPRRTRGST